MYAFPFYYRVFLHLCWRIIFEQHNFNFKASELYHYYDLCPLDFFPILFLCDIFQNVFFYEW